MTAERRKLQIFHSKGISHRGPERRCNLARKILHPSSEGTACLLRLRRILPYDIGSNKVLLERNIFVPGFSEASDSPDFRFRYDKFLQESRMLKKAAALFLVCASIALCLSCGSTTSRYLFASIPGSNQIVAYREDPNSGVLTQLTGSPITAGQAVQSLAIHPSGKFLYAANSGEGDVSLYTISSAGGLTEVTPRTVVGTAPTLLTMDSAGS